MWFLYLLILDISTTTVNTYHLMSLHYDPINIQLYLYNGNLKSEKAVVMTGIIERAKIDQRQEIIHLQEKLQQLSVQMNDEVNRSVD